MTTTGQTTAIDIDTIRARADAAAPGPWVTGREFHPWEVCVAWDRPLIELDDTKQGQADAEFIAAAREDIPALLAEVDRLRARLERIAANATETAAEFDAAGAGTHARLLRAVAVQAVGEEA